MRFAAALATAALIIVVMVTTQDRSARRKAQDEIQMKVRAAAPTPATPSQRPIESAPDVTAEAPPAGRSPAHANDDIEEHEQEATPEENLEQVADVADEEDEQAPDESQIGEQESPPQVAAGDEADEEPQQQVATEEEAGQEPEAETEDDGEPEAATAQAGDQEAAAVTERDTGESTEPLDPGTPWSYRQMHTVCFGINDYAFDGIPDLNYAQESAVQLATVLRQRYGYDNWAVTIGPRASRSGIIHMLDMLANKRFVQEDDAVLVYFAGHVQTVSEQETMVSYLIPQDARLTLDQKTSPEQYRRQAIRLDELLAKADRIAARHVLFIIDAPAALPNDADAITAARAPSSDSTAPVRQLLLAGRPGQKNLENEGWAHSAFTNTLLDALREQKRTVSLTQLFELLRQRLPKTLADQSDVGSTLEPQAATLSGEGDFLFVRTIPNAYYTDPQAREVIDAIIQAHGGEQRIRALNKVKTVTYRNSNAQEVIITRWEMPTALRIDLTRDDKTISQCSDNNDLWVAVDDELMFATPEMAQSLRRDVEDGVFQQAMLSELLDEYHKLIFHGKEQYNDQEYWLLESIGVTGRSVKKYYDPNSFLEKIKITKGMMGSEAEIHKSFGEFAGVFYPKESELRNEKNMLLGSLDVIEVTSDFDEAIFFRPIMPESEDEAGDEEQGVDDQEQGGEQP